MFFTLGLPGAGATLKTLCRRPSPCDSSSRSQVQSAGERPHSLHSSFPVEAGAGRATRGGLTKTCRKGQNPLNQNEKTWTGGTFGGTNSCLSSFFFLLHTLFLLSLLFSFLLIAADFTSPTNLSFIILQVVSLSPSQQPVVV